MALSLTLTVPFPNIPSALGAPIAMSGTIGQIANVQHFIGSALGQVQNASGLLLAAGNPVPAAISFLSSSSSQLSSAVSMFTNEISQVPAVNDLLSLAHSNIGSASGLLNLAQSVVPGVGAALQEATNIIGNVQSVISGAQSLLSGGLPSLLTGDMIPTTTSSGDQQWGLFDSTGAPVIEADSVVSVEYRKEYKVSNFPIENGGFQAYNKVETPYDARLSFNRGGTDADRRAFLTDLEGALNSLDLYTIVMPEYFFNNANVVHYDFARKSDRGVTLLMAEVWVEEIRVSATEAFSQTAQPSGTASVNDGAVQTATPDAATAAALAGGWQ